MDAAADQTRAREAKQSLAGPNVAVAAALVRGADARIERVLLATDLSAASDRATEEAIALAVDSNADLLILSVVDPGRLRIPGGAFLRRVDQERARIELEAQRVVTRARAAGARATFLVWEGDPAESIIAAAEAESVDLIVLGSHRRGILGRLALGSISATVSEGATRPVVVVPR